MKKEDLFEDNDTDFISFGNLMENITGTHLPDFNQEFLDNEEYDDIV
jgi:hypothetical protein